MKLSQILKVALWNIAAVALIFVGAEIGARVISRQRLGPAAGEPEALFDRWTAFRNNPAFSRPGVRHTVDGFRRDRPIALAKPANTVRIFLMGGSVTYGADTLYPEIDNHFHITGEETIDSYLEKSLTARFPAKRWEVVNAGVKGYLLHQDLALLLSAVLKYKPDCVVLLDGVNDLSTLTRAPPDFDAYAGTAFGDEFSALTHPTSFHAARLVAANWLRDNSVLIRLTEDYLVDRRRIHNRMVRAREAAGRPLTPAENEQYEGTRGRLDYYTNTVRRIHRVLAGEGVRDVFALQPFLLLTRKPLAGSEPALAAYCRSIEDPVFIRAFETIYPELPNRLEAESRAEGFEFVNLVPALDGVPTQAFTDYCHLTPDGDRAIADVLLKTIAARPLP